MKEYPHIDSVYKRDKQGKFILGDYSCPEFEYLKDNPWVWTEKIDGTNIRIMFSSLYGSDLAIKRLIGGKTDNASIPARLIAWIDEHIDPTQGQLREIFETTTPGFPNVCLYGEGYGAGIQKGGAYSPDQKFILFDVKIDEWWLKREDIEDVADKLNLDVVPILNTCSLQDMVDVVQELAISANITSSTIGNAKAEGFVGQPTIPMFNRRHQRIITKVKYCDFT